MQSYHLIFQKFENDLKRANNYFNQKKYDLAINAYIDVLKINSCNITALNMLGCSYYMLENYHLAYDNFSKAIKLNPKNPGLYNNRGNVYVEWGNLERAMQDYYQAVEVDPHWQDALDNIQLIGDRLEKQKANLKPPIIAIEAKEVQPQDYSAGVQIFNPEIDNQNEMETGKQHEALSHLEAANFCFDKAYEFAGNKDNKYLILQLCNEVKIELNQKAIGDESLHLEKMDVENKAGQGFFASKPGTSQAKQKVFKWHVEEPEKRVRNSGSRNRK